MSNQNGQYRAAPIPQLDKSDGEIWLDVVCAALTGFASGHYTRTQPGRTTKAGDTAMVSASVAAERAVEAADSVLAAYKNRLMGV